MRVVPGWWAPALAASWIAGVLGMRMLGMPERAAASVLACGLGAGTAAWNLWRVLRSGRSLAWAVAIGFAMALAAIIPPLNALLPGRRYAALVIAGERGELSLPDGPVGPARVLVALGASSREPAWVDYTLRVGTYTHKGSLVHGDSVAHAGDWARVVHVDQRAVYLNLDLPSGAELTLTRTPSADVPVRLEVYGSSWAGWAGLALGALPLVLLLLLDPAGRRSGSVPLAATAVAAGLIGGWTITPEHALRSTLLAWAGGAVFGQPAGFVLTWAKARIRTVRRRASGERRRKVQRGARA